jgi:hypothetical protein
MLPNKHLDFCKTFWYSENNFKTSFVCLKDFYFRFPQSWDP